MQIVAAILDQLESELTPHLPEGFLIQTNPANVVVVSPGRHTYEGQRVDDHVLKLWPYQEYITVFHAYYLPDDWPFRAAGLFSMRCNKYYNHPHWLDQIASHLEDLGADPNERDISWNPRHISVRKREKKRQQLIAHWRHCGLTVPESITFRELREISNVQRIASTGAVGTQAAQATDPATRDSGARVHTGPAGTGRGAGGPDTHAGVRTVAAGGVSVRPGHRILGTS